MVGARPVSAARQRTIVGRVRPRGGIEVPLEDLDGRRLSTTDEVAQSQDVAILVLTGELVCGAVVRGAVRPADGRNAADPVLIEPEPDLRIAAGIEPVRPEVQQLARRVRTCRTERRWGRVRCLGISCGIPVKDLVLVGDRAGLPPPSGDQLGVLGTPARLSAREDRLAGHVGLERMRRSRRVVQTRTRRVRLVADVLPVLGRGRVLDGVLVQFEHARVMDGERRDRGIDRKYHQRCRYRKERSTLRNSSEESPRKPTHESLP